MVQTQPAKPWSTGKQIGCGCLSIPLAIALVAFGIGVGKGLRGEHTGNAASTSTQTIADVTYSCTGYGLVSVTYGPEGSQDNTSANLPVRDSSPYDPSALYYAVQAQLQGSGSVTCTTTVDGVTQSASASGGYDIAMAEVCNAGLGWKPC